MATNKYYIFKTSNGTMLGLTNNIKYMEIVSKNKILKSEYTKYSDAISEFNIYVKHFKKEDCEYLSGKLDGKNVITLFSKKQQLILSEFEKTRISVVKGIELAIKNIIGNSKIGTVQEKKPKLEVQNEIKPDTYLKVEKKAKNINEPKVKDYFKLNLEHDKVEIKNDYFIRDEIKSEYLTQNKEVQNENKVQDIKSNNNFDEVENLEFIKEISRWYVMCISGNQIVLGNSSNYESCIDKLECRVVKYEFTSLKDALIKYESFLEGTKKCNMKYNIIIFSESELLVIPNTISQNKLLSLNNLFGQIIKSTNLDVIDQFLEYLKSKEKNLENSNIKNVVNDNILEDIKPKLLLEVEDKKIKTEKVFSENDDNLEEKEELKAETKIDSNNIEESIELEYKNKTIIITEDISTTENENFEEDKDDSNLNNLNYKEIQNKTIKERYISKYYVVTYDKYKVELFNSLDIAKEFSDSIENSTISVFDSYFDAHIYSNKFLKKEIEKSMYHIYTDGSYSQITRSMGYGLVISKDNEILAKECGLIKASTVEEANNIYAEITAMLKALEYINVNDVKYVCFHHDYINLAKWIEDNTNTTFKMALKYKKIFKEKMDGIIYSFLHSPAHTKIKLHDEADRLAKIGSKL